jgi:hypothetical protein
MFRHVFDDPLTADPTGGSGTEEPGKGVRREQAHMVISGQRLAKLLGPTEV